MHEVNDASIAQKALQEAAEEITAHLKKNLPRAGGLEAQVIEAMEHAVMAGGKRLRPFMVLCSANLFGVSEASAMRVAIAVEYAHTYSLVHDDLPCMDDDDLRRGQPTVHKKYDEATAVLAGDALLTLAFEILAGEDTHPDPRVRCELIAAFARALGAQGMVGGQMFDLLAENRDLEMTDVARMQKMKTGALIEFSCEAGAILGKASPRMQHALKGYAHDLGLAFQIIDDLLDNQGDSATLGKTPGKDQDAGKATLVSLLGTERAQTQAQMLTEQAIQHLEVFEEKADILRSLVQFVIKRAN